MIKRSLVFSLLWLLPCAGHVAAQSPVVAGDIPTAEASIPTPAPRATISPIDFDSDFTVSIPKGLSGRMSFSAKVRERDRILVLDLDGRRITPLVEGEGNNTAGVWSPDGESLAFVSDRDGNKELYIVRWDGVDERRLTVTAAVSEDQPAWHPNGKELVFIGDSGTREGSNIFSINVATGETRQITHYSGRNINPRWSPNGATLAFATNRFWPGWRIVLSTPGRGGEEFLSKVEGQVISQPIFSRDGERVYFANNTPGGNSIQMVKLTDRTSGSVRQGDGRHIDPVPSPDDKSVAFAYAEAGSVQYAIFVIDRNERSVKPLISSTYSLRYPSWNGVKGIALEAAKAKAADGAANEPERAPLPPAAVESAAGDN